MRKNGRMIRKLKAALLAGLLAAGLVLPGGRAFAAQEIAGENETALAQETDSAETEGGAETENGTQNGAETETDAETEDQTAMETEAETETESETETEPETETESETETEAAADLLGMGPVIFIGDSYSVGYSIDPSPHCGPKWQMLLAGELGLHVAASTAAGGYGFCRAEVSKYFIDLLAQNYKQIQQSQTAPDQVRWVIVTGGYNDKNESVSAITSSIAAFVRKARQYYPNAKVAVGMSGWTTDSSIQNNLRENVTKAYREGAQAAGAVFMNNMEYVLRNGEGMFSSDGIHPNEAGQQALADAAKDFLTAYQTGSRTLTIRYHDSAAGKVTRTVTYSKSSIGAKVFTQAQAGLTDGKGTLLGWSLERGRDVVEINPDQILTSSFLLGHYPQIDLYAIRTDAPAEGKTGFVSQGSNMYYLTNGSIDTSANGLIQDKSSKIWYDVKNGKVNFGESRLIKRNGVWYYTDHGKITWSSNTLAQVGGRGTWYYIKNSQIDWTYTGLFKYGGTWYYINKGRLDWTYTGLVKHGGWYYVKNGKLDWTYTGLVKYGSSWYYVKNGKLDWTYTGLARNGGWFYVNKGKVDWAYSGPVLYNGRWYRVVNGKCQSPLPA